MAGLSEGEVVNGNITVTFDYAVDLGTYQPKINPFSDVVNFNSILARNYPDEY